MSDLGEALNNNIVQLDWLAPAAPKGVKKAIAQLAQHWMTWWDSSERKLMPPVAVGAKLERYAEWYARAWFLVPPEVRARVLDPRQLDASLYHAIDDQIRYMTEGAQAATNAGAELASYLKTQAKDLRAELEKAAESALSTFVIIALVAAVALFAFGYQKGRH
jgi:hypothetical protein